MTRPIRTKRQVNCSLFQNEFESVCNTTDYTLCNDYSLTPFLTSYLTKTVNSEIKSRLLNIYKYSYKPFF
jgi:hypothetical protein